MRRQNNTSVLAFCMIVCSALGCGSEDGQGNSASNAQANASSNARSNTRANNSTPVDPVMVEPAAYTYKLEESTDALPLWTTPVAHKVRPGERAPSDARSGLILSAARGEFEPVQLILDPGQSTVEISVQPFDDLGATQRVELAEVLFEDQWPEGLRAMGQGGSVTRNASRPSPVWLTIFVPRDAPAGEHRTTLTVGSVEIPVTLTVFDFAIPEAAHFATQLNISVQSLTDARSVEEAKQLLFEHRFTPKSVTWPSGFKPQITWDSGSNPGRCESFYDEFDEGDDYAIGALAKKYMLGEGWNGVGFPTSMLFQFVDNSTPRPAEFCGQSRGDHYGSQAYNQEWSKYLSALQGYLEDHDLLSKSYYYVQNEPQNDEDHALAAHLCRLTKAAAPELKIAISEEPKPQIAEHPDGGCGYDIWIAHIAAYQQTYAWQRQAEHGEQVWFYSLDQDAPPFFNPTRVDRQGMDVRAIPWVAWSLRITGWAYYDFGRFFDDQGNPGLRAELLREAFEDYEYLWLANGKAHPPVGAARAIDATVQGIGSSLTSWSEDADAMMVLRHELGRFIEGSRDSLPVLQVDDDTRPKQAYYLNFQDPGGQPGADPLEIDDKTFMKIGWGAFDDEKGYGWSGENIGTDIVKYGYDDVGGFDEAQKSYVYDDYGRLNRFEFKLPNGAYTITIGVGRPAKGYPGDPHNLRVEGQLVVDDEQTTNEAPLIERQVQIELQDGALTLEVGGRSESTGMFAYTFLGYVAIEPVE